MLLELTVAAQQRDVLLMEDKRACVPRNRISQWSCILAAASFSSRVGPSGPVLRSIELCSLFLSLQTPSSTWGEVEDYSVLED